MRTNSRTAIETRPITLDALRRALPDPDRQLFSAAVAAAVAEGVALWVVGGAVRDLAAAIPLHDIDLAVDRDAEAVARRVAAAVGGEVRCEPRFGTAVVTARGLNGAAQHLDIAVLRTEQYARPGALPTVQPSASIEDDLRRRDFTVSALAVCAAGPQAGRLADPCGGLRDLAARRLRVLHPRSVADDATRLWRGARLAARLHLRPDAETQAVIEDGRRWLAPISGARLWAEVERTAAERRLLATVRRLAAWGVLDAVAPGWRLAPEAAAALRRRTGPIDPALLLAVLLAPCPAAVREQALRRLTAPGPAQAAVRATAGLLEAALEPELTPEVLERLTDASPVARVAARWLDPARQPAVQRQVARWERTRSPLDAHALQELGVPRGPLLGEALRRLRRERYLGTLTDAHHAPAAAQLVQQWLADGSLGSAPQPPKRPHRRSATVEATQ